MKKTTAFVLALVLTGCGNEPVQTVEWFKLHTAERLEVLARCESNPGELALTPNCQNARSAHDQIGNARKGYAPLPARS